MGYSNSKWRKILTILMIINLCFILFARFSKVFGVAPVNFFTNCVDLSEAPATFEIGSNQYGGTRTVKLPSFMYDYNNILVTMFVNEYNTNTKSGMIIFSNSKIMVNNNGLIYGEVGEDYYYKTMSYYNPSYSDLSNTSLSDFSHTNNANNEPYWNANLTSNSNYGYTAVYGSIYEYNTDNIIIDNNSTKYPEIANTQQQLETLDFDVLSINAWDYSNEDFDVLFYDLNYGSDTTESLYPVNVITLNKDTLYYNSALTSDPDKNAIYWIPIEEMGFNWVKGNKYGIKFAVRDYGIQGGGGFRGDDYIYQYIGEETVFTISNTVPDSTISALNNSTQNNIQNNQHEEVINNMNNITNNLDNVNDALTNTNPDSSVSSDIDNSLNFNNQNEGLNNLNNGFFSRLTSMLSNLLGYDLGQDTSVSIPLPNSNKSIVLHSIDIYNNVTGALRLIINAFWVYIFSFYMWKFINKIYIAVSTGNILDTFSSSGEAITNDML